MVWGRVLPPFYVILSLQKEDIVAGNKTKAANRLNDGAYAQIQLKINSAHDVTI